MRKYSKEVTVEQVEQLVRNLGYVRVLVDYVEHEVEYVLHSIEEFNFCAAHWKTIESKALKVSEDVYYRGFKHLGLMQDNGSGELALKVRTYATMGETLFAEMQRGILNVIRDTLGLDVIDSCYFRIGSEVIDIDVYTRGSKIRLFTLHLNIMKETIEYTFCGNRLVTAEEKKRMKETGNRAGMVFTEDRLSIEKWLETIETQEEHILCLLRKNKKQVQWLKETLGLDGWSDRGLDEVFRLYH